MVLLFSSDRYPAYKKDIFAVTSLPDGYCYHFRYPPKYVSQKIRDGLNIENSLACLVFVAGNSEMESLNLSLVPIRLAKIVKVYQDHQTDLYHVYFALESFIEMDWDVTMLDEKPPETYLGIQVIRPKYREILWKDLVKKLDHHGNAFFFHVKILSNLEGLRPCYDLTTYESFFEITEGKSYGIQVSISDNNHNKSDNKINIAIVGTDIKSNIGETLYSGLSLDSRNFTLAGLILGDVSSSVNLISVSTDSIIEGNLENNYSVRLLFNVKKDPNRRLTYFCLSALILLGGGIITADLTKFGLGGGAIVIKTFSLIVSALSAANLFYRFNKK